MLRHRRHAAQHTACSMSLFPTTAECSASRPLATLVENLTHAPLHAYVTVLRSVTRGGELCATEVYTPSSRNCDLNNLMSSTTPYTGKLLKGAGGGDGGGLQTFS